MRSWGSLSFLFGPLVAFVAVGLLAGLLRWAFTPGRSLVARRPRAGAATEYGLLVPVVRPTTVIQAEIVRSHLASRGITATLAPATDGPAVLVWPRDLNLAREILGTDPPPPYR